MTLCHVCGNEIERGCLICRFCATEQQKQVDTKLPFLQKTVNLERGRPSAESALHRLTLELDTARREGVKLLIVIHGYGSSGKGGVIRDQCRKVLDYMRLKKEINDFIPGEECSAKAGLIKALIRRYPHLEGDRKLRTKNPGITVVIL